MTDFKPKRIEVVPYTENWAQTFEALANVFKIDLEDLIIGMEHVGSTAVPGLAAKPVIDLDLIIRDKSRFEEIKVILGKRGYLHVGEMGIPGREAFKRSSEYTPLNAENQVWPAHHLYVCLQDSVSLKNHLLFRDYLRANPETAAEYGRLKMTLAEKHPYDIDRYIDGKTDFIITVLEKTGFDKMLLNDISGQNKIDESNN
ncbi:GrpB domain, predicted nucleotidyltransferase, UPF0157 family [Pedobacter steynii]|uniref:GrpB domain, predicted nucleotidyltransferase, UPF0157 family n=1 Tax=Pedobacter steynii TaxID=430522 RepID=A0A1G9ZCD1_9SPHI|nr:GrpB family protein [Pedobacter steynii]NQX40018.1 GrpB family protein [Pedobacter steynii]SDN19038.1 GrpB domain, predicted nucleotidyltransferase, UPF0157 family [Pedobacter steynii]